MTEKLHLALVAVAPVSILLFVTTDLYKNEKFDLRVLLTKFEAGHKLKICNMKLSNF